MKIEEIYIEAQTRISFLSAKPYKVESAIKTARKNYVPAMCPLDTGAGMHLILRLIVPASCRNCMQRPNVALLGTADRKTLEIE